MDVLKLGVLEMVLMARSNSGIENRHVFVLTNFKASQWNKVFKSNEHVSFGLWKWKNYVSCMTHLIKRILSRNVS